MLNALQLPHRKQMGTHQASRWAHGCLKWGGCPPGTAREGTL